MKRRSFIKQMAAGSTLWGLGDFSFLNQLPPVSAAEARLNPGQIQFSPEIEPLVRLLEETPRERLLEEVGSKVRHGLSYREIVAALLLAGIRNVQPRPVGFKFHAVLVVNSAHLASLSSPDSDRWLPIFWALDYFKSAQARNMREGNWRMAPVDEAAVPAPNRAKTAFVEAMNRWDPDAADAAAAGLARQLEPREIFELFSRFGARDFRDIGHKAIYVANGWRTLQYIGWQHAEPVVRSLAYALLYYQGENPARSDATPDRAWKRNQALAPKIRAAWQSGKPDDQAAGELLQTLRKSSEAEIGNHVVDLLNRGIAPQTLWDAIFAGAGELLMRQPGIVPLHAVTTTNAVHFAYQSSSNDESRRLLLLQNAAFLAFFRGSPETGKKAIRIDQFEPLKLRSGSTGGVAEIFADLSRDRTTAARKALSYLKENSSAKELIDAARRLVFLKGEDSHDYKFSSAVLEDYAHVSPAWRDRFLAASLFMLHGSGEGDNDLVPRIRAALKS